jgi:LacI family transcriptional regulator
MLNIAPSMPNRVNRMSRKQAAVPRKVKAATEPPPVSATSPTSAEVARRAGVSRTTVSFVLNDVSKQGISAATRDKVLAVARELGYEPNAAARSLAGGVSGTVALVLPQAAHLYVDAFLAQLVASVNEACHRHGLKLLIESTEGEGREPGGFVQLVRSRRIDGLIVAHPRAAELDHLRRLRDQGIPLVVFGADMPEAPPHQSMGDDTAQSAQMVVRHLLALGHRRIAFVNYARPEFRSVHQRELGWRLALEAHGVAVDPKWLAYADISAQSGYEATRELLARRIKFTALFAGNDTIAFGALRALHEAGRRVPQDVAVVGYDDIPLAPFASPPLTSVRSDPAGHGRQAVQMLLAQLRPQAEAQPREVAEPARLIVRESCGAGALAQGGASRSPPASRRRQRPPHG